VKEISQKILVDKNKNNFLLTTDVLLDKYFPDDHIVVKVLASLVKKRLQISEGSCIDTSVYAQSPINTSIANANLSRIVALEVTKRFNSTL